MADKTDDERCVPCDIAWWCLVALGGAVVGVLAVDVFTNGAASSYLTALFRRAAPALASVTDLPVGGESDSDAG
jgi:hypothetical protein